MLRIAPCAVLLLFATLALGQQPTNPDQQQQQQSPKTNPQDKAGANSQIQSDLDSALRSDPVLSGTDVQVAVDDVNITLTGSVQSQGQMDRVMALTSPYARYRNVVNKIAVH
jgi:osmotically-inducible protein OsmY